MTRTVTSADAAFARWFFVHTSLETSKEEMQVFTQEFEGLLLSLMPKMRIWASGMTFIITELLPMISFKMRIASS